MSLPHKSAPTLSPIALALLLVLGVPIGIFLALRLTDMRLGGTRTEAAVMPPKTATAAMPALVQTERTAGPLQAEAITAAFGSPSRLDASGAFTWVVPAATALPWPDNAGPGDVRGAQVRSRIVRLQRLSRQWDIVGLTGDAPRWLLVTAGVVERDGEPVNCATCGYVVSAFVLTRSPANVLSSEVSAPVLGAASLFAGPPRIDTVAVGPDRQALRIESSQVDRQTTTTFQDFWLVGVGFPHLLDAPLPIRRDDRAACGESSGRVGSPGGESCTAIGTFLTFVPAQAGETDDPAQWIIEADVSRSGYATPATMTLPEGVHRLPFRRGRYRLPS